MSLALNIVLWLMIKNLKRCIDHNAKNEITLLRLLYNLNDITKRVYNGKELSIDDKSFLITLDLKLSLDKERQKAKMQA